MVMDGIAIGDPEFIQAHCRGIVDQIALDMQALNPRPSPPRPNGEDPPAQTAWVLATKCTQSKYELAILSRPGEEEADLPLVLLVLSSTEEPLAAFFLPALDPECAAKTGEVPGEDEADARDEVEDAAVCGAALETVALSLPSRTATRSSPADASRSPGASHTCSRRG